MVNLIAVASSPPIINKCSTCPKTSGLLRCTGCNLRCTGCKVTFYCSPTHQTTDWANHKGKCNSLKKAPSRLQREKTCLQNQPLTAYDPHWPTIFEDADSVGNFWGIMETRPYMRARFGVADILISIPTRDALEAALGHFLEMLRLCRSDNMGVRDIVPGLYLRLGRDQECYDFVKWWTTTGEEGDYDWGDTELPYLDVKDADLFEDVEYLCQPLDRMLMDLYTLQASKALEAKFVPEMLARVQYYVPRTMVISNNKELMNAPNIWEEKAELIADQLEQLFSAVAESNAHMWHSFVQWKLYANKPSPAYSPGSIEEMQLYYNYFFQAYTEDQVGAMVSVADSLMNCGGPLCDCHFEKDVCERYGWEYFPRRQPTSGTAGPSRHVDPYLDGP